MKRTAILSFILITLSIHKVRGQQDPMYTMYMLDKVLINPAYAGSGSWAVGTLKYRQQFVGFEGNPVTETFNFHTPIQKRHIGLGLKVISDQTAVLNNLNVSVYYSYHLNFAGGKLSAGLEGGIYNRKINFQDLVLTNPTDNTLPTTASSSIVPDFSAGLYYQKKQFYLGYAFCHLVNRNFRFHGIEQSQSHLYGHMYLLLGKVAELSENWTIEPSCLVKYQAAAPVQADANLSVSFKDRITLGAQYRTGDAAGAFLKIAILESLRVAYAYDFTISGLSGYSGGAHEIILSYGIKLPPPPAEKEIHPRYYF